MISDAIRFIFNPKTPFWTGKAMDLLFDGIPINCTSKNFKARTICSTFEAGEIEYIQQVSDDATEFKFSLFGAFNDSTNGVFKVYRGKKEVTDIGRIVEVDGQLDIDVWNSDEENKFKGTDGYWIPPFRNIHDRIWVYERQICATLDLEYTQKTHHRGVPLRTFSQNLDRFSTNKAYCRENGSCPIQGTLDLFNCIGVPLIATLPHFLDTHPSLLANIQSGLQPNRKAHEIYISIDLKSGIPFLVAKRLQINFELAPIPEIEVMANFRSIIFPWIWVEERLKLNGAYVTLIHSTLIS
ncbi:sensory neuron membrane protein 1-like [Sitodiplosis mosellana]|uniref:sensory neuron membrane protein 1-like n=1 Tax=Sitodiplosis mosellana TaxID=263140 RepID=UPI0024438CA8|nr:sensory neuron membrane protein 1-like [Sitodiplosis mosellana]